MQAIRCFCRPPRESLCENSVGAAGLGAAPSYISVKGAFGFVFLALSVILGLAVSLSHSRASALPSESYVEVLAEDQNLDYFEPVHIEPAADQH